MRYAATLQPQPAPAPNTSACDTFCSLKNDLNEVSSDGVIGLARAFLAAGADALMVALWKVDDDATRTLMGRCYGHYLRPAAEGGGDAALALQRAMVSMIEEGLPVQQWSPFVVYGLGGDVEGAASTSSPPAAPPSPRPRGADAPAAAAAAAAPAARAGGARPGRGAAQSPSA